MCRSSVHVAFSPCGESLADIVRTYSIGVEYIGGGKLPNYLILLRNRGSNCRTLVSDFFQVSQMHFHTHALLHLSSKVLLLKNDVCLTMYRTQSDCIMCPGLPLVSHRKSPDTVLQMAMTIVEKAFCAFRENSVCTSSLAPSASTFVPSTCSQSPFARSDTFGIYS